MSGIDGRAEALRRAAEVARAAAEARRVSEDRPAALASALSEALADTSAAGAPKVARLVTEVIRLPQDGQQAFFEAAAPGQPISSAVEAVRARIREAFSEGERRAALGEALVRTLGMDPAGLDRAAREALVPKTVVRLGSLLGRPRASLPRDAVEPRRDLGPFGGPAPVRREPVAAPPAVPPSSRPEVTAALASASQPSAARVPAPAPPVRHDPASAASLAFERELLREALGPPPLQASNAVGLARVSGPAIKRISWKKAAPQILGPGLRRAIEKLQSIPGGAERAQVLLAKIDKGPLALRVAASEASGLLDRVRYRAERAHEALGQEFHAGISLARTELRAVRESASEAQEALGTVAHQSRDARAALGEVEAVERASIVAEGELRLTDAKGGVLEEIDQGEAVLLEAPGAEQEAPPAEGEAAAGEQAGVLTDEDVARIGAGLDPSKPPPQTLWREDLVNTVCDQGLQQGGLTTEEANKDGDIARSVLNPDGTADLQSKPKELTAADLAAALKMSGVPLERIDPNQIQAAARYVSTATTLAEQQDKLRKTLDNFHVLAETGPPRLGRQQMVEYLWATARVPGHALEKLPEAKLAQVFQEVAAALNGGPGEKQLKIGDYNLKLEIGAQGELLKSECKKPGFFSRVWGAIKKYGPYVLTAASFIPVIGPFARAAQGVISLVQGIRSRSLIGIATAGAAIVGAGAAISRGASTVVGTVERIANSVAAGLQGISSLRQGNILGGLASIGAAVAGGIGRGAGSATTGLQRFADRLGQVSGHLQGVAQGLNAVQSYRAADRAVRAAREMLAQAEASGDPRAIAAARRQLEEAERGKRAALLRGLGTAAMVGADTVGQYRRPAPGQPSDRPTAGTRLESALRIASRSLSTADSVVIRDWEAAGVGALGVAAGVADLRSQRPAENRSPAEAWADGVLGSGPRVSTLNDAANVADAALAYRQAERAQAAAEAAVKDAERALDLARRTGEAEAIRQAEDNLWRARRSAEGALMGQIGAADAMVQTPPAILAQRRAAREFAVARDGAVQAVESAEKTAEQLAALGSELPADLRGDARSIGGALVDARARYEEKLRAAGGDPSRIAAATWGFMAEQMGAWADLSLLEQEAAERTRPRIIPASATGQSPLDPREGARAQLKVGRDTVKDMLDRERELRRLTLGGGFTPPWLDEAVAAAHRYEAALNRLETVLNSGGSDLDRRRAQAEAHLAHRVLDAAQNPHRSSSDPPPWAVGLGTFVKEFGTGALAVVSFGGTAGIQRAYDQGRLNSQSGPDDVMRFYLEGVFSGITFGGADAYVDARAGEGRGILGSSGAALLATLKGVAGYDEVKTILADPNANAWEKGQAVSILIAKWAGLAALGVSRTRYAEMEVGELFGRKPAGPAGAGGSGTIAPKTTGAGEGGVNLLEPKQVQPKPQGVEFGKPRGGGGSPADRAYASQVTGGAEKAVYVNGVEFESVRGGVLIEAKRASAKGSFYDISGADNFTQRVKIPTIVDQAKRQLRAVRGQPFRGIEWQVSDLQVARQLQALFVQQGLRINVVYTPKKW